MNLALPIATFVFLIAYCQPDKHTQTPAAGSPTFAERLERVDMNLGTVRDLRAEFEQRQQSSLLKRPLVSKGRLWSKDDIVLWETNEPRKIKMLVTKEEVQIFYPDDKLVEVYGLDNRFREAAGGPLPRLAQLKERFELSQMEPKDFGEPPASKDLIALRLTPKSAELKKYISSVRVLIDERIPCANRIIISDPDGDQTEIQFLNVRINTGVKEAEVSLHLPDGVKVSRPIPNTAPTPTK